MGQMSNEEPSIFNKAGNGKVIVNSEAYSSESACLDSI